MGVESVSVAEAISHVDTLESFNIPLLEYCCQLWNSWKTKDIQAIEAIQRTFTYKITEVQHLNYRERVHELKLCSLQRRSERYILIYIWKITHRKGQNIVGTMGHKMKNRKYQRHGTQCVIQYPTDRNPARTAARTYPARNPETKQQTETHPFKKMK